MDDVFQRKILCRLCNGCRNVRYSEQKGPVMLCAYNPKFVCNLQTDRDTLQRTGDSMIHRRLRRYFIAVVVVLAALNFAGCPKEPYRAALQGSDDVASAVHSALKVTTQYYGTGKLTDSEKSFVAGYLETVTNANLKFRANVMTAHTGGAVGPAQYLAFAQAFVDAVPTDPTTFGYKNPDTQKEFATVLGAVKTALNGISLAIQNAQSKGGQ